MKISLSGLQPNFDLGALRGRLAHFAPVVDVRAVRDGDPQPPWAIVEIAPGVADATEVARRIDGMDRLIRARVMFRD